MFLNPRPVIWSANDMVRSGISRLSVTSEIAMVSDDANAPRIAVTSFCVMRRCATVAAVVGVDVASATTRLIFAPARRFDPSGRVDLFRHQLDAIARVNAELGVGAGERQDNSDVNGWCLSSCSAGQQ